VSFGPVDVRRVTSAGEPLGSTSHMDADGTAPARPAMKPSRSLMSLDPAAVAAQQRRPQQRRSAAAELKPWFIQKFKAVTKDYDISSAVLGKGSFSLVRTAAHRRLKVVCAVKLINKRYVCLEYMRTERDTHSV